MRVLVTRPLDDARATAEQLRKRGHEALISPLLMIATYKGPAIDLLGVQAVLVTSANGVRALAGRIIARDIPVFAVGPQTAGEAEDAGFSNIRSSNRDAVALADAVSQWTSPEQGELLHASGSDGAGRLAGLLADKGFRVRTEILYAVSPAPMSQQALEEITAGSIDAVMLYSPRSARLFRDAISKAGLENMLRNMTAICISPVAAEALAPLTFAETRIAAQPNQEALLACLG